jgi:hypothetical protein
VVALIVSAVGWRLFGGFFGPFVLVFVLTSAIVAVVVIHELGHALAAVLVGYRVRSIGVGPIWLSIRPLRLDFQWNRFGPDVGGLVEAEMRPLSSRPGLRQASFSAGGPLANITTFILLSVADLDAISPVAVELFLKVLSSSSLLIGLASLVPYQMASGHASDGKLIWLALTGAGAMGLSKLDIFDRRPRDWSEDLVRTLGASTRSATWPGLEYLHFVDTGKSSQAAEWLAVSVERIGEHPWLNIEAAFLAAFFDRDASRARALMPRLEVIDRSSFVPFWRAEAAVRLAEGDDQGALEAIREARLQLKEPRPFNVKDWVEQLNEMEARALGKYERQPR